MSKRRMIETRFWSDNFIVELNPLDRYLFLYFLTNEHTNICGIYELPIKRVSDETGLEKDMILKMLKRLKGKVTYVDSWVAIRNFSKYQSDNESVRTGIKNAKALIPKHILERIDKVWQGVDTLGGVSDISEPEPELEPELESKPKVAETSSAEVSQIIKEFEIVDSKNKTYYGNTTQRKASAFLIGEYGFDRVVEVIKALPKINTLPYISQSTTPDELMKNWVKLENAYKKNIKSKKEILI